MPIEGAVYFVLMRWPSWPPPSRSSIYSVPTNGGLLTISGTPDRRLEVTIRGDQGIDLISHSTAPLEIVGDGLAIVGVVWNSEGVEVYINSKTELPSGDAPFRLELPRDELDSMLSFQHPEARRSCENYVLERSRTYSEPIDYEFEIDRLAGELIELEDLLGLLRTGRVWHENGVRGKLRSLLVMRGGRNYDPNLPRVAAALSAPLPIFAPRKPEYSEEVKALVLSAQQNVGAVFGTIRAFKTQELIDLEEFLRKRKVARFGVGGRAMTLQEVILDSANTLGGAHSSPKVPQEIRLLASSNVFERSVLSHILQEAAEVTISLGRYLMSLPPPRSP